jgi:acyl-CoA dehydrogenase
VLEAAIKYARSRKTFGKRLMDHQVIRHKIAHMAKHCESLTASLESLVYQMDQNAKASAIGGPVALLKVQSTQSLEFNIREASQIFGGASFQRSGKGQRVERAAREIRVAAVGGGSEEILIDLAMRMAKL